MDNTVFVTSRVDYIGPPLEIGYPDRSRRSDWGPEERALASQSEFADECKSMGFWVFARCLFLGARFLRRFLLCFLRLPSSLYDGMDGGCAHGSLSYTGCKA